MVVLNAQMIGAALNDLLATHTRGLSRHLQEAKPYLTATTYPIWKDIQKMLAASAHHAELISHLLDQLQINERAASFELAVARFHYTQLSHLLPMLIEEKQSQVDAYLRAIDHTGDDRQTAGQLNELLADVQGQLVRLQQHQKQVKDPAGV